MQHLLKFDCWSSLELGVGVWCLYRGSFLGRSVSRKDSPWPRNFSSNFCVQSQSQHAHGSVPFSCRQLRRECASCTLTSSKYSSQYGRSSASGGSQKQVSTRLRRPHCSPALGSYYEYIRRPRLNLFRAFRQRSTAAAILISPVLLLL